MHDHSVRVFVSSTFRDFAQERDRLAKFAFPALRAVCDERGVVFTDIDLRWGITEEQVAEGRVLPICLEEIDRSRPFFVGILGERYGWVPETLDPVLVEREPWLEEHKERSVTELEMVHGVLSNPAMADRALFYFRDPAYVRSFTGDAATDFVSENPEAAAKLQDLKARIRASGLPLREGFSTPAELAEWVEDDLRSVIDQLYPPGIEPSPREQQRATHEAYARTRRTVYLGRRSDLKGLDTHALGDGPPLVVTGESGSGKTALVANWSTRFREAHPDIPVVEHYVGASSDAADWELMARRLAGELAESRPDMPSLPDERQRVAGAFKELLYRRAASGRSVIVIDGINQLEDLDGALDLAWLPEDPPKAMRVILTALPGRSLQAARDRGWDELRVRPLDKRTRKRVLVDRLARYRKELPPETVDQIASARQTANPLYLRLLVDELRLHGDYLSVGDAAEHYLRAHDPAELYELVLARWESDYEGERPELVRDVLTSIWAARRGLTEAELLALLGGDLGPAPRGVFAPLYAAARRSLIDRSGFLGFGHDFMRYAVVSRYGLDGTAGINRRRALAEFFEGLGRDARALEEVPWQLARAGEWSRLAELLADLEALDIMTGINKWDPRRYWSLVEANSDARIAEAYRNVIEHPEAHLGSTIAQVALLLRLTGHLNEAVPLWDYIIELRRDEGDPVALASALRRRAGIHRLAAEYDAAEALLEGAEVLSREAGDLPGLAGVLGGRAMLMRRRGRHAAAMELHLEEERIRREIGAPSGIATALSNRALVHRRLGENDTALRLWSEAETIWDELGSVGGIATCHIGRAITLKCVGDDEQAETLILAAEALCRQVGSRGKLSTCIGVRASLARGRGEYPEAMSLLEEQEALVLEIGNRSKLATCYVNMASLLREMGLPRDSFPYLEQAEEILRAAGALPALRRLLREKARCLEAAGEDSLANRVRAEAESIVTEQDEDDDIVE